MIKVTGRSSLYDQGHLNLFYSEQSHTLNHPFDPNGETNVLHPLCGVIA